MSDDDEVRAISDSPADQDNARGRGARGRTRYRGRFPRRGDGTSRRPFRGFRPPRRPRGGTFSPSTRGTFHAKSSKKDGFGHRSERRSRSSSRERRHSHHSRRSRSRSRSPSRSRRSRSRSRSPSPSRSRHSRSRSPSRSRRSRSRSALSTRARWSPPSRSRSSPSRRTRTSPSPPPRGAYIPKSSRYYNKQDSGFDTRAEDPVEAVASTSSAIGLKFRSTLTEVRDSSPGRDKSVHRSLSPDKPLESLRITVDNDYFGPPPHTVEDQPEMGRNSWNRKREDDRDKDKKRESSIQPVWKKRKVIGVRDMDAYDDDVNYTRIAKRASPPPEPPPPEMPESKFQPVIKQEVKPRPGDNSIFSKINQQSWDWNQKGSKFLEDTPKPLYFDEPDSFPGFRSSSDVDAPDVKLPLRSCLRKADAPAAVEAVKLEPPPRQESPPLPKCNIPGLDLVNTDDEDEFLYGDADNSDKEKETGSASFFGSQCKSGSDPPLPESEPERSSGPSKDGHASFNAFLKQIGLKNNTLPASANSPSEELQQQRLEVNNLVKEGFSARRPEPSPAAEQKRVDPRLRAKQVQAVDPNAGRTAAPANPEPVAAYPQFDVYRSDVQPSPAMGSAAGQYPNYGQPMVATPMPPPGYPQYSQYDPSFYGAPPVVIPGLMAPPMHPPVAMSPYPGHPMPPGPHFPPAQAYPPAPMYPPFSMAAPTTTSSSTPGWVSSLTPVQTSRSNLKVVQIQSEGGKADSSAAAKPAAVNPAVAASTVAAKLEEFKTPTNAEERKRLLQTRLEFKKRLDMINNQVEDCRKRQGELMRKKQRQKDGHNDPQLTKLMASQEAYSSHISPVKKQLESIDKALKASEHLARKPSASSGSRDPRDAGSVSGISRENVSAPKETVKSKPAESVKPKAPAKVDPPPAKWRYVDSGNHWCKHCHDIFKLATDLLKHLHTKHLNVMERLAPADRPWATKPQESSSANLSLQPFQGVEFMLPSQAFYCSLCCVFSGDLFEARNHLESEKHNYNHSKYCLSNPNYQKRVQSERASSIARKKEENKRKLTETLNDSKGKIEDPLKDSRQSRHSKSASSTRRNHSIEADSLSDDDANSSSKKQATTKTNIKLNLLKKDDSIDIVEVDEDSSYTISTPQSKIPFKLMGKGVSTSLAPAKTSKKSASSTVEDPKASKKASSVSMDDRTQRILSNLKKKRIQDKSERSEPLPLEDFVSIALEGGLPADCKLPVRDKQTVMAAAKELKITPNFFTKASGREFGPQLPPAMEIGPQLPPGVDAAQTVQLETPMEITLESPQPPPPGEESMPEPPQPPEPESAPAPPEMAYTLEPLPPGVENAHSLGVVESNVRPPPRVENVVPPPAIMDFDAGNLDALSEILDAIPMPEELDDMGKPMEESAAKESEIGDVEMEDIQEGQKPDEPNSSELKGLAVEKDHESMDSSAAAAELGGTSADDMMAVEAEPNAVLGLAGGANPSDAELSASITAEDKTASEASTLVIDCVTSLASVVKFEALPDDGDVGMMEPAEDAAAEAEHEYAANQEPEPKEDDRSQQSECPASANAAAQSAGSSAVPTVPQDADTAISQAGHPVSESSVCLPEDAKLDESAIAGGDVSTAENTMDSCSLSLPSRDEETTPLINGTTMASSSTVDNAVKRPQLAICSRGRGRGRGGVRSLPLCSVVIKQETFDACELEGQDEEVLAKEKGSSNEPFRVVIKQEPMSPPRVTPLLPGKKGVQGVDGHGGRGRGQGKAAKLKVRVKQEQGGGESSKSVEMTDPEQSEEEAELARTMVHLKNLESSIAIGNSAAPSTSTPTKANVKGELGETSSSEDKLDDALLDDDNALGLPHEASEGEEKLDDNLLNDSDSAPNAGDAKNSDISFASLKVVDEA